MRKLLLTTCLLAVAATQVQAQRYISRTAKVSFNATAPGSPEKIEAVNNEVANILDASTGDLIFQVPVKSFKFERALMEEHFNENYMESDKFPKAEFKGKIANTGDINFTKEGTYPAKVTGKMTIHGETHEVSVPGTITVSAKNVQLSAKFPVKLADYKIEIAKMVADKIGREATIVLESSLARK